MSGRLKAVLTVENGVWESLVSTVRILLKLYTYDKTFQATGVMAGAFAASKQASQDQAVAGESRSGLL